MIIPNTCIIRDPWVTKGLLQSSKTLDKLFHAKLKHSPTHNSHNKYIQYRNLFNKTKRVCKHTYYTNLLNLYKDDIKNTWKSIRTLLGKSNDKTTSDTLNLITQLRLILMKYQMNFVNILAALALTMLLLVQPLVSNITSI